MTNRIFPLAALSGLIAVAGCQVQPLGNTVAFSRLTGDNWQIWTMRPDGKAAEQITISAADKRYPVWSTDGNEVFFRTNNNEVFAVDLETGEETRVLTSLRLSGGLVPSPDGSRLVFVRFRTQLKDSSSLWLTTALDARDSRILTRDQGLQYDPDWSPDGRQIVYVSGHGYRKDELYVIDSGGGGKRRLTNNDAIEVLPAFSPDGKTIAYVSDVTGNYEIWLMDPDGSDPKQLTRSKGIDTKPCWSPDGKKIMFVSNRSGTLQLWAMNSDGSNPWQLTTGAPSMDPAWRRK